ncbi:beta-ketoacyl-ACP reductase [Sphaerisporangium siamense]|uniref:3-oxoacyl-[acyl-carrier protein] reductase n=1 Tax=Sphaerisporangium siamense TaxID=795645 RepID=A0A7W7DEF9_9ACTN|nr:SDR family oxidoreductase [Sphaerisporangium siamense]MBB4704525.1 3-oxoacyl-[acyl-carrier protein] reductase [Sphaerisporangium siamense]GII86137.1 beta-ketoacyl-ACP reductase [Sphaerisporangium siamense]
MSGGVALVTGAGSGIGQAVADSLAAAGYTVVCAGRRLARVAETAEAIRARGGAATAVALDVTVAERVDAVIGDVAAEHGRLDVLVNNAGVFRKGEVLELSEDAWRETIEANLTGAFLCARAAARLMTAQEPVAGKRGQIVNVNSGAGLRGYPTGAAYSASKFGLLGLSDTLRAELAGHLVKVTDLVVAAMVESELSTRRDVTRLPATVVGDLVRNLLALEGPAVVTRLDLGQLPLR